MSRPRLCLLTAAAASLALVPLARPAPRVIGGQTIQIQAAPWAVFIRQAIPTGFLQCSGSIIDAVHVLTAAHCVYDLSGNLASITSFSVRAGVSNLASPAAGDNEQDRTVSSLRVHPGYAWSSGTAADDVAVLALDTPLDLSGDAVQAVGLPQPGAVFPAHAAVALAGFGRQLATRSPNGSLSWYAATTGDPDSCGGYSNEIIPGDDAVAICASSPTEAICTGDSGSGLVATAGAPTLIGVASAGRPGCDLGTNGVFTYVAAPEILRFVQGDDSPPVAPRRTDSTNVDVTWRGPLDVGNTVTCRSSGWLGSPSLAYEFVDSRTGDVLQEGAQPGYQIAAKDLGATIYCRVLATNAGGTATLRTEDTSAVAGPPRVGITTLALPAAARGRLVTVRVVVHAGAGLSGRFGVCITPPARIASRVCTSHVIDDGSYGGFPFTLGLRIKQSAPVGVASLAIDAVAGVSRATTTATLRVTG